MKYPVTLFKGGESREVTNGGEEAAARRDGFCEPYKFQEFPKHLYKEGKRTLDLKTFDEIGRDDKVVANAEEEKAARAAGYRSLGEAEVKVEKVVEKVRKAA